VIPPRTPEDGLSTTDVLDTDAEIELLRCGAGPSTDPALRMLVVLRDDIDRRAAAVLGRLGNDEAVSLLESALSPVPAVDGASELALKARRNARRRRLVVIPLAGALVLGSTGVAAALSGSRGETFYPLHQVIFGSAPSSDAQIARDVAEAGGLLDDAARMPFGKRGGTLIQAHVVLVAAQELLPAVSSSDARARLSNDIAAALLRAAGLAQNPAPAPSAHPITPSATPSPESSPEEPASGLGSDGPASTSSRPGTGEDAVTPVRTASAPPESQPVPQPSPEVTSSRSGVSDDGPAPAGGKAPSADDGWR
jgi:hypothetical protein